MHGEHDYRTRLDTLALYTGHSTRYLVVRGIVRAIVCIVPLVGGYIYALN